MMELVLPHCGACLGLSHRWSELCGLVAACNKHCMGDAQDQIVGQHQQ